MTARQANATSFNPNGLDLTRVARYERLVDAPLERVWENVLDWEHLPHLHETSFDFVELDSGGDWGWRTWSDAEHSGYVELCVADSRCYVARTYQADAQVTEIWTTLEARAAQTAITVEFHLADVEPASKDALGDMMLGLYTRLWDEDEAMMRERQHRLHESRSPHEQLALGQRDELVARLAGGEQIIFQLKKREFQLRLHNNELLVHSTICPHLLGPLTDADLSTGRLRCPWHGYEFDLASGRCVNPEHASCALPGAAELVLEQGELIARVG